MSKLIMQVTGPPRAGKSETCQYLEEKYGFKTVRVSDMIRRFAGERAIALARRRDYRIVYAQMKQELGSDIIARTVLETQGERLSVDGIRVPADVERLRSCPQVLSRVIALDCPQPIRFQRSQ